MIRRSALVLAVLSAASFNANALVFDQDVTNDVIYGSGNTNGSFTVDRSGSIEVGLRAHVRYAVSDDQPANIFNSNGDGTYSHAAGHPVSPATRARWNFDWSINTSFNGSGQNLAGLIYQIGIDYDPTLGTNYQTFDPINLACADHSFGNNGTGEGLGAEAACPGGDVAYAALVAGNNLVQQSWNLDFFDGPGFPFNPDASGFYDVFLSVSDTSGVLARSQIRVCVGDVTCTNIPEPASLALLGLGLAGLGFARRKA